MTDFPRLLVRTPECSFLEWNSQGVIPWEFRLLRPVCLMLASGCISEFGGIGPSAFPTIPPPSLRLRLLRAVRVANC